MLNLPICIVVMSMDCDTAVSRFKSQFLCYVYFRPNEPQFSWTLKPKVTEKWPPITFSVIIEKRSRINLGHFCQIELPIPGSSMTSFHKHTFRTQVANTRPAGWLWPSILFYLAQHLVPTRQQRWAPCPSLRSSYTYTVLKLYSALWRQPPGWCASGENEFDPPALGLCKSPVTKGRRSTAVANWLCVLVKSFNLLWPAL